MNQREIENGALSLLYWTTIRASDPRGFDDWRPLVELGDGRVQGDCESFAITLRDQIGGQLYFCYMVDKETGERFGHVVLKVGDRWCDINSPTFYNSFEEMTAEGYLYVKPRRILKVEELGRRYYNDTKHLIYENPEVVDKFVQWCYVIAGTIFLGYLIYIGE